MLKYYPIDAETMFEVTLVELSLCTDDPAALAPRLLLQHLPDEIAGRDVQAIAGNLAIVGILCHACKKALRMALRCASDALRRLTTRRAPAPAKAGSRRASASNMGRGGKNDNRDA